MPLKLSKKSKVPQFTPSTAWRSSLIFLPFAMPLMSSSLKYSLPHATGRYTGEADRVVRPVSMQAVRVRWTHLISTSRQSVALQKSIPLTTKAYSGGPEDNS